MKFYIVGLTDRSRELVLVLMRADVESPSLERTRVVDAGCKIACFWQGALEISLRFVSIVSAFTVVHVF